MKYLIIMIFLMSACANRAMDKKEAKAQITSSMSEGIEILEVFQRMVVGGMERDDGKHVSNTYTMILQKAANVNIEKVYLYGEKKEFESFVHEGKFYLTVKVYPNAVEPQEKGEMIQTSSAADVYFEEDGAKKVLTIDEFPVKETIKGN